MSGEASALIQRDEKAIKDTANAIGGGAAQALSNVETKFTDDYNQAEKNNKTKPRTFIQKFLFMLMAGLQAFVVYMVMYEIDYGLPALRTTGGPIVFQYASLIFLSFVLSVASFLIACFPPTAEKGTSGQEKNDIRLGVDTANATVGTFLVQALSSNHWGAEGDIITLLKYLIQYQVLITYVNVGFTIAWSAPHIELPGFITDIGNWLMHIDEHINDMLEPITDFFGMILYAICWPFIKLWAAFCYIVSYLLSFLDPLKYVFAYIVVGIGRFVGVVSEWVHCISKAVWDAFTYTVDAISQMFVSIGDGVKYVWVQFIANPVIWLYNTIIDFFVSLGTAIANAFHSMMESLSENFECIKHAWEACTQFWINFWEYEVVQTLDELPELFEEKQILYHISGYIEKRGHFRTNWTTRFFTLKRGVFKYFLREGNQVPRVGEGLKGELDLRNYEEAHQVSENPLEVHIRSNPSTNKNYQFRVATEKEARNLVTHLNLHIKWLKNPEGIIVQDGDTKLDTTIMDRV